MDTSGNDFRMQMPDSLEWRSKDNAGMVTKPRLPLEGGIHFGIAWVVMMAVSVAFWIGVIYVLYSTFHRIKS